MEKFSLEKWLQDKSRKIVTRDGREVRIICTDLKNKHPIVAAIEIDNHETPYYYDIDGKCLFYDSKDLFFADEKEELTEFEKGLNYFLLDWIQRKDDYRTVEEATKESYKKLLDLARKEIEKENPYSGNQKQEWSEEDEKLYTSALWHIKNSCGNGGNDSGEYEVYNWLKSLKDRVQPKQEWSEEDKSMYIRTLGILGKCYMGELPTKVEEELKWFKSITDKAQPQTNQYDKGYEDGYSAAKYNQWKPKKEELEALRKRTYFCEGIDANLDSLYTNLLKL